MLLSELVKKEETEALVYGVEVDEDILTPPKGLRKIGLLYKGEETISDDLVDAIIAFSLAGIEVVVEISPTQKINTKELLTIAGNAGFSISLLPPETPEENQDWFTQCAAWANSFLDVPNFTGTLYPVSGYFGYLAAKQASNVDAITPNDTYALQRFVNKTDESVSDQAKGHMLKAFEEKAGGTEAFEHFLAALNKSILLKALDILETEYPEQSGTAPQEE